MSSRVTRALLKLYPRRIRNRYGEELLDLDDELRAHEDVSRTRLIRDVLTGALLVQPARRVHLVIGSLLVIGGLATAGAVIGAGGTGSATRPSHPQLRLAVQPATGIPYGACFVTTGSSCSSIPCTEFTGRSSSTGAVVHGIASAGRRRRRGPGPRCVAFPHVQPQRPVFVGG